MTSLRRLYANRWIRYALTLVLLGLVLYKVNLLSVMQAAGSARPQYLALALALTAPFLYCKVLRWHLMLDSAGVQATFSEAALSVIGGMGLALVTPARLGELVRGAYLRDPQKLKIGGLVMIDKGLDVLVLTCLSVAGAFAILGPVAGALFTAAAVAGFAAVFDPTRVHAGLRRLSSRLPMRAKLERIWSSLESLTPRSTAVFLVLTLLSFVIVLIQFGIILLSWHSWSPDIVLFTFPIVILTNVLPVTIGGLGVREATAAVLLGHYGVPSSDAVLAALLMFAINTAAPGLVGALVLPLTSRSAARAPRLVDRS
ncbi:MAG TPA: lysylphosphatidylglycerol synthase transmembrane domain-containing protein [Chloroflexota bacterium]